MRIRLAALILLVCFSGCGWLRAAAQSPQAAVDYFDWARERNERGCYAQTVDRIEKYGAPYCTVSVDSFDYPILFSEIGLETPRYNPEANAIRYPLGDHEALIHEISHSIISRGGVSQECVEQLAAQCVVAPFSSGDN